MSTPYNKEKPETIQEMFGSIAQGYDRANAVLSFQMHKLWNRKLVQAVTKDLPHTLLDLCCGTGDIAFDYLRREKEPRKVLMLDFCPELLEIAKKKAQTYQLQRHTIEYIQADAQALPLPDASIPSATMAYGIRNIQDPLKSIKEVHRVLQPGGIFGILELTQPQNRFVRWGHKTYLSTCLPLLGKLVTQNQHAYEYLCNSIQNFIPPDHLESLLKSAGFAHTSRRSLFLGTATLFLARK